MGIQLMEMTMNKILQAFRASDMREMMMIDTRGIVI